jgi:DNA-binding CsgD family transcriptional regulator
VKQSEDESTLLDRVTRSDRAVALFDVSTRVVLAASGRARERCGFVDVDLADVNIVDGASNPGGVRKLLELILEGHIKDWKVRSWLHTPDGGRSWGFATGQAIDVGGRRLALGFYPSPTMRVPDDDSMVHGDIGPMPEAFLADPRAASATIDRLSDRVVELEDHLHRILSEIQAAGITPYGRDVVSSETPGLESLSTRELEIISRMLQGERVPTIARRLGLSAGTVRNHLSSIYQKVGIHSQAELIEALQTRSRERYGEPNDPRAIKL